MEFAAIANIQFPNILVNFDKINGTCNCCTVTCAGKNIINQESYMK